jgi:hypothetical protein
MRTLRKIRTGSWRGLASQHWSIKTSWREPLKRSIFALVRLEQVIRYCGNEWND